MHFLLIINMDDFSLYLLDIVENSINAKASIIEVLFREDPIHNLLTFEVRDNGVGMTKQELSKAVDPFYTTRQTRRVGLGLPFLKQTAMETLGTFEMTSEKGKGTFLKTTFTYNHIDLPPLGDLAESILTISMHHQINEFIYQHEYLDQSFVYRLKDIKELLNGVPITEKSVYPFLKEYIREQISKIRGGIM